MIDPKNLASLIFLVVIALLVTVLVGSVILAFAKQIMELRMKKQLYKIELEKKRANKDG